MPHVLFNNEKEFKHWAYRVLVEDTYGNENIVDWDLRDDLKKNPPKTYPVIITYDFYDTFDRCGDIRSRYHDYVYLAEFSKEFDPDADQKEAKAERKRTMPFYLASEKLRDLEYAKATPDAIEKQRKRCLYLYKKLRIEDRKYV